MSICVVYGYNLDFQSTFWAVRTGNGYKQRVFRSYQCGKKRETATNLWTSVGRRSNNYLNWLNKKDVMKSIELHLSSLSSSLMVITFDKASLNTVNSFTLHSLWLL